MEKLNEDHEIIIIPAYEPDEKLIDLINEILFVGKYEMIVVNDGSSDQSSYIFNLIKDKVTVLTHDENMGKGAAIKTALKFINLNYEGVSTIAIADADGQHKIKDINKIIEEENNNKNSLILGSRTFKGEVPLRSKLGNQITSVVFKIATNVNVSDTQTGLRAFQSNLIPVLLKTDGNRYEYEMNMLLNCAKKKINICEVPIETVYIEDNKSSHFNPIRDSFLIYKNIIKFSMASLISFIVDYSIYTLALLILQGSIGSNAVIAANVIARIISSTINYNLNRKYVFENKEKMIRSMLKYFSLVIVILTLNTFILSLIVKYVISNAFAAKILVEVLLFILSYNVQKYWIFKEHK